ncbi:NAD-dependent succinate-semialdehyde dehydrogenase [Pseudonocardia sp.]|uniref:NAD-dependent succinate-semialdehyde dehydrogenase n=1 Tax=Pseudonocardia sp. TaxID=60912 RepID=UPI003D0B04A7
MREPAGGRTTGIPTGLLIGGVWRDARSGMTFTVADPATGDAVAEVADARPDDVPDLVEVTATAFPSWSRTPPRLRAELLRAAFDELSARSEEFARLITLEMGKPLAESRAEVRYGAEFLRWYAEEAVRVHGMTRTAPDGAAMHLTLQQPVGPALLVTPWNFPLAMATRKIAPALAAGCTVLLKPAEETPLTALLFAELLHGIGVPPGVVNVVTTSRPGPVVERILADRRIRKLSFTGSTEVGRTLLATAAAGVVRTSMELGGNAPFIVYADADLDAAVEGATTAKLRNGGQSCVAANRFIVERPVAAEFVARLTERLRAQVTGPGSDPATTLGPLVNRAQRDRAVRLVHTAIAEGAEPVLMDEPEPDSGFLRPVVLNHVPHDAHIAHAELFAPVAPIYLVDTEQEALRLANATEAGLVAFVYSTGADTLLRAATALECGMVGLNRGLVSDAAAPFGGTKQSGLGREGGEVGLQEYLETKYVSFPAGSL